MLVVVNFCVGDKQPGPFSFMPVIGRFEEPGLQVTFEDVR